MSARLNSVVKSALMRLRDGTEDGVAEVRKLSSVQAELGPDQHAMIAQFAESVDWLRFSADERMLWRDLLIELRNADAERDRFQSLLDRLGRSAIPEIPKARISGTNGDLMIVAARFSEFTIAPEEVLEQMRTLLGQENSDGFAAAQIEFLTSIGCKKRSVHARAACLDLAQKFCDSAAGNKQASQKALREMTREFSQPDE